MTSSTEDHCPNFVINSTHKPMIMLRMACDKTPLSLCTTIALHEQTRIYLSVDYKTLPWFGIHIMVTLLTDALQIMNEPTCDRIFHLSVETESPP